MEQEIKITVANESHFGYVDTILDTIEADEELEDIFSLIDTKIINDFINNINWRIRNNFNKFFVW